MNSFSDDNFEQLLEEYRIYSVIMGRTISVVGAAGEFTGKALDFSKDGSLLVQRDDGRIENLWAGDVSIRGETGYV